jgi:hypothetical protein
MCFINVLLSLSVVAGLSWSGWSQHRKAGALLRQDPLLCPQSRLDGKG